MNEQKTKVCLNCKRSDQQTPLLTLTFQGEEKCICGQCLPLLIHKTHMLVEHFPGIELSNTAE